MKWRHLLKLKQKNQEGQKNQEKNDKTQLGKLTTLWSIYFASLAAISWGIGYGIWIVIKQFTTTPPQGYWILSIGCFLFIAVTGKTIIDGWSQVRQRWEWNVELFGKWVKIWKAGLHIGFPYFGFMKFKAVYMGEQQMELFISERRKKDSGKEDYGFGEVEFKDGSAPVEATIYFQVLDAKKAAYNIKNLFMAIEEKMDSAIRAFLGLYKIDEANTIKSRAHLKNILNGERIELSDVGGELPEGMKYTTLGELKKKMEKCSQWELILDSWGTMITGFAISDIILPKEIKEARHLVLVADKEAEAAKFQKQTRVTLAEGEEQGLIHEGTGIRNQVKKLITAGVKSKDAVGYLADRLRWKNVGEKGATVIIDSSGGGIPGIGAQLGAGFQAGSNPKETTGKEKVPEKTEEATDKEVAPKENTEQLQQ